VYCEYIVSCKHIVMGGALNSTRSLVQKIVFALFACESIYVVMCNCVSHWASGHLS